MTKRYLNRAEVNAILAGLRLLQSHLDDGVRLDDGIIDILDDDLYLGPHDMAPPERITVEQIDTLCDDITFGCVLLPLQEPDSAPPPDAKPWVGRIMTLHLRSMLIKCDVQPYDGKKVRTTASRSVCSYLPTTTDDSWSRCCLPGLSSWPSPTNWRTDHAQPQTRFRHRR